jgi:hypothetical protein
VRGFDYKKGRPEHINSIPPYKRWGSVAEPTSHLQGSTSYEIRFSHKTYRRSPTKHVTQKDLPLTTGPLIEVYAVQENFGKRGKKKHR